MPDPVYELLRFEEHPADEMARRSADFLSLLARRRTVRDYS